MLWITIVQFYRENLHAQITANKLVEPKNKALSKFKVTQELSRLSQHVSNQKEHYQNQLSWPNTRKNKFIQVGLNIVIKHMDNGNLAKAHHTIKTLKQKYEKKFGKTNFLGQKSKSFEIIESVDRELSRIKSDFEYETAELQKKAMLKELVGPKLERDLKEGEDELTVRARNRLKSVKDRLGEVISLDRKNKSIDKAYIAYTAPRDEGNENQEQYGQRIKAAADILVEKLNIKQEHNDKEKNQQIMIRMAERQENYRQSLFTRGKGTLAERLDKAWDCYNDETRTIEDRIIAQSYLIFVLDIKEEHITEDLNVRLQSLMLERTLIKEKNPEYIPGKSPIALDEESKGKLKKTKVPGVSDDQNITEALKEKTLLDINLISRKKDSGENTGRKTEFFDARQRDMLRVLIRKGNFVTSEGQLFDTSESISKNKKGFAAFTLNVNGEFSVFQHRFQEVDGVAHSSINAASPVFCAGEVRIEKGKLLTITDRSGHYAPSLYNIYKALDYLKNKESISPKLKYIPLRIQAVL